MLEHDRTRAGWSCEQAAWRLGITVQEYRDTSDPALLRAIVKVREDAGSGYWWVECSMCACCWQVPFYAAKSGG